MLIPAADWSEVEQSFSAPKKTVFRINSLGDSAETKTELTPYLQEAEAVLSHPEAYAIPKEKQRELTETVAFQQGGIYIQNPSSMLAPLILDPQPGEKVLDLAAAPGGKSTLMAALMRNQGELACVEPVKDRFHRLRRNLEQQKVNIARMFCKDGRGVGKATGPVFDKVMLDAPCSSESRFHLDDPKSMAYWSERKIKEMSRLQKRLLESALHALKPGGEMLYCTCSFAPEENELVLQHMLGRWKEKVLMLPIELPAGKWQEGLSEWKGKPLDTQLQQCRRVLPDDCFDGFFLAKIKKVG